MTKECVASVDAPSCGPRALGKKSVQRVKFEQDDRWVSTTSPVNFVKKPSFGGRGVWPRFVQIVRIRRVLRRKPQTSDVGRRVSRVVSWSSVQRELLRGSIYLAKTSSIGGSYSDVEVHEGVDFPPVENDGFVA